MSENSGYATFALFHTLHLHFTQPSYDYFKYHGKCNISKDKFLNRRDKYIFYAISRKYNLEAAQEFFVCNLFEKSKCWIGELNNSDADDIYKKWQKKIQSLTYNFEQDIIGLLDKVENPNDIFMVKDGQEPLLLKETYYGSVMPETMIILNNLLGFCDMWKKKINDDIVFPEFMNKCTKYSPFVRYDKQKFKNILLDKMKEYV